MNRAKLIVAACFCFGLSLQSSAHAQSVDTLYEAAKKEGAVVIYAGGTLAAAQGLGHAFEARFPGIKVTVVATGASNTTAAKIEELIAKNKFDGDATFLQTVQEFALLERRGQLLRFEPEGADTLAPKRKGKAGDYFGFVQTPAVYVYNTEKVAPTDIPRSALDFLDPKFKNKLISSYPQDDEGTMYAFYTIVKKYGWSYMDKYMANEPVFVQGHANAMNAVASGEKYASLDPWVPDVVARKAAGKPIEFAYPQTDTVPVWWVGTAAFKAAAHPNAGKLFVAWMISKEMGKRFGGWPVRSDIPSAPGLRPLSALNLSDGYLEFLQDTKTIKALRARFAKIVGPIKQNPLP
jgi:ABC-type Fe3+ transport system substrate-binding protein